mmetsp:Transcript_11417/g.19275  ORF Transcript_11417/g.19275 Transcript_11417/m.19275 type:complete len:157 (+) Transcript_11417:879-1349(+)
MPQIQHKPTYSQPQMVAGGELPTQFNPGYGMPQINQPPNQVQPFPSQVPPTSQFDQMNLGAPQQEARFSMPGGVGGAYPGPPQVISPTSNSVFGQGPPRSQNSLVPSSVDETSASSHAAPQRPIPIKQKFIEPVEQLPLNVDDQVIPTLKQGAGQN